jgi:hypothetical protein
MHIKYTKLQRKWGEQSNFSFLYRLNRPSGSGFGAYFLKNLFRNHRQHGSFERARLQSCQKSNKIMPGFTGCGKRLVFKLNARKTSLRA